MWFARFQISNLWSAKHFDTRFLDWVSFNICGLLFRFLAHPLPQVILADLWMGGLRMRKNPVFKIFCGIWIPPLIPFLEFKTKEELELMPQTEEELQDRDDSDSNSSGIYIYIYILDAATSSGILKAKQKLGRTFNSDKLGGIAFTKISKLTMCSA